MSGKKASNLLKPLQTRRGLTTPVSILLIFCSLTMLSSIMYYYAMNSVEGRKLDLKRTAAMEKMLELEEAISSVAWSPDSSKIVSFSDYGGSIHIQPMENRFTINVSFGDESQLVYNSCIGQVLYQLPNPSADTGDWIKGDPRAIVNTSFAYQAQIWIDRGEEKQEVRLRYRPLVSSSQSGLISGRRLNNIRIYVINLNSSQVLSYGQLHLRALCLGISNQVYTYNLTSSISSISIEANVNGSSRTVEVRVESGSSGSTVRLEVLNCQINLRRVGA